MSLSAFQHTLEAIQQMSLSNNFRFAGILAPTADAQQRVEVERQAYTKRQGFRFDLSTLSTRNDKITLDLSCPMNPGFLSAQTALDDSQAEALISSLCRSLTLVQGPPGSGKSYIGVALIKVLVSNIKIAQLGGPVLFVTSSDQALDQTLQHLVDANINGIIRVGSRSKGRLSSLNLQDVTQRESMTHLETRERIMHEQNAARFRRLVEERLSRLQNFSHASILDFLREKHPRYYVQLVEPELGESGFQLAGGKLAHTGIAAWLQGTQKTSPTNDGPRAQMPGSTRVYDIFSLEVDKRQSLYSGWKEEAIDQIKRSLLVNLKAYQDATAEIDKIGAEVSHRVLARANVIVVTASGLARNRELLHRLHSKVLLVEEANEVLEAHLLTAMLPSIEHAILIGDHQLRLRENPCSQVMMDVSLFERLVRLKENENNALQVVTLETQHRMHPSISALMSTTYPDLRASLEAAKYSEVSGMLRRLFWLDHRHAEDSGKDPSDSAFRTNNYEVETVSALVRHLLRQDVYRSCDIAILTLYHGQLRKLHRALSLLSVDMRTSLHDLRLAKIDGFQGREAKIVIVSLVRSNGDIAITPRTSSRINSLLSRAQHGMYIIGNSETFAQIPMFGDVLKTLKKNGNVGPQLELYCPRHPGKSLQVSRPDDLLVVSPEGGCDEPCGKNLPCGHLYIGKCHSDGMHQSTYCLQPCGKSLPCGHACINKCHSDGIH
jgi:hypothetical protein